MDAYTVFKSSGPSMHGKPLNDLKGAGGVAAGGGKQSIKIGSEKEVKAMAEDVDVIDGPDASGEC